MEWLWLLPAALLLLSVVLFVLWRPLRSLVKEIQVERARELLLLQRARLEAKFMTAAAATGKPRGLRGKDCAFEREGQSSRERQTRQLVPLLPVTVQFEAI